MRRTRWTPSAATTGSSEAAMLGGLALNRLLKNPFHRGNSLGAHWQLASFRAISA
jgi:hypothetical protein